jgi:hypothetical protein
LRYRYVNSFQNFCYDFLGGDEVIFTIVLFVLQKLVGHPVRRSEVNLAIDQFRDNGRALGGSIYGGGRVRLGVLGAFRAVHADAVHR